MTGVGDVQVDGASRRERIWRAGEIERGHNNEHYWWGRAVG